jgi:hypothetical protein
MLDRLWFSLIATALHRIKTEERGDSLVSWIVLALGLCAAAAALIAILRPGIETAARKIVTLLTG